MRSIALGILILILDPPGSMAEGNGQDEPPTPAAQFEALRKEYDRASSSGVPLTDAERLEFIGRVYRHRSAMGQKFLELAEKHPDEPFALDALMKAAWQVNTTPWPVELVGEDPARAKALELIQRDYIRSDKLAPLCQRVSYGFCKEYETFLRRVLMESPHESVQAMACVSLGSFLKNRAQRLDLCKDEPDLAKEFAGLYGEEYFAELRRQDPERVMQEIEAAFERAVKSYGDVKLRGDDTIAKLCGTILFEIRNLRVGKKAPDIEGEDQNGRRFRLSEYRGKVILLDFWSYV
jgi:hypothetical protein